jgi:hypothetical protein
MSGTAQLGMIMRGGKTILVIYSLNDTATTIKITRQLEHEADDVTLALMVWEIILFQSADGEGLTVRIDKYRLGESHLHIDGSIVKRHLRQAGSGTGLEHMVRVEPPARSCSTRNLSEHSRHD